MTSLHYNVDINAHSHSELFTQTSMPPSDNALDLDPEQHA